MAFGKKDKDEKTVTDGPATHDDVTAPAEQPAVDAAAPVAEADAPGGDAAAPPTAAAPAAATGTDALLSMFETTKVQAEDNTALLELAGDAEIDDLLEMLQTVAAALGIDTSTPAQFDEEQVAA
jgi:hypothetical protein